MYVCSHTHGHVPHTYIMEINSYTRTHPTTHTHVELQDPNVISWARGTRHFLKVILGLKNGRPGTNPPMLAEFHANETGWHALLASKEVSEAANAFDDCGLYFEDQCPKNQA
jgi:hypothetical protein